MSTSDNEPLFAVSLRRVLGRVFQCRDVQERNPGDVLVCRRIFAGGDADVSVAHADQYKVQMRDGVRFAAARYDA